MEPRNPKPGDTLTITVGTSGGKVPLDYTIKFTPDNSIKALINKKAEKETFSEKFTIPSETAPGITIEAHIEIKDKQGTTVEPIAPQPVTISNP